MRLRKITEEESCAECGGLRETSAGNARLQFHAAAFHADAVFDFVAALILEVFRLLLHEPLEIFQARRSRLVRRSRCAPRSACCRASPLFPSRVLDRRRIARRSLRPPGRPRARAVACLPAAARNSSRCAASSSPLCGRAPLRSLLPPRRSGAAPLPVSLCISFFRHMS